jgi:hypothetical protein
VYEALPVVVLSPLACLLLERDTTAAWHVMGHRKYFPSCAVSLTPGSRPATR